MLYHCANVEGNTCIVNVTIIYKYTAKFFQPQVIFLTAPAGTYRGSAYMQYHVEYFSTLCAWRGSHCDIVTSLWVLSALLLRLHSKIHSYFISYLLRHSDYIVIGKWHCSVTIINCLQHVAILSLAAHCVRLFLVLDQPGLHLTQPHIWKFATDFFCKIQIFSGVRQVPNAKCLNIVYDLL